MKLIPLIIALAMIGLTAGCCCASTSSMTDSPTPEQVTEPIKTTESIKTPTTPPSIQAAIDDAKIRNRNNVDTVEAVMGEDGAVDVNITDLTYWDEQTLKRSFLEASYETMDVLAEWPGVEMVRIRGFALMYDAQGNEVTRLVYMAIVSDMAKAKTVNWKNLPQLDEAVAISNFDSVGGTLMKK